MTEWLNSPNVTAETALAANTFAFLGSLNAAALAARPFTVIRTVGSIWVKSDQVASAELPFGALGFQIVSDKAVATGVTALPDPITEEASDTWFVYQQWAASGGAVDGAILMEYKFDSRAMRKVEDGFDMAFMIANANAADGVVFVVKFCMLIKLA